MGLENLTITRTRTRRGGALFNPEKYTASRSVVRGNRHPGLMLRSSSSAARAKNHTELFFDTTGCGHRRSRTDARKLTSKVYGF